MKTAISALVLIVWSGVCYCQKCTYDGKAKDDIYFPDIRAVTDDAYQLGVEFTVINKSRTDYFREYYDKTEKKGRVDVLLDDGSTTKYYYYSDNLEAFEISETNLTCVERNVSNEPRFMKYGMREWKYTNPKEERDIIHGPSAMFRIAYEADQENHSNLAYMGNTSVIRGIPAEYWRRCLGTNITAEYYFSTGKREGVYGLQNLTSIPLRIVIYGQDPKVPNDMLPQNYEILSYVPFLEDPKYTFELPSGMGCGRKPQEEDNKMPSFEGKSLNIGAEVLYTDYGTGITYASDFTYAFDIDADYVSYYYTPWTQKNGKKVAGDSVSIVYDARNKYIFKTTYSNGQCVPGSTKKYIPSFPLLDNKGYISLTDSSVFYPNDEFYYLGLGKDRGYEVEIYERAYPGGYILGDKLIKNAVVTHYFVTGDNFKDGPRDVKNALTRIRMSFNGTDEDGQKMNAVLNFNFYSFSTGIDDKASRFNIERCFRDEDDIMFITVGFTAEESDLELITEDLPSVVENARSYIREVADVVPARLPNVMVDFRDALYVTFVILERAPVQLDFDDPQNNTVISNAVETEGVTFLDDCAYKCLEGDFDCWGFAHCGATCYIGAGQRTNNALAQKNGCQYYNRTNFLEVPRLKAIRRNLEGSTKRGEPQLTVAKNGGGVITFKPSYIGDAVYGESQELFDRMGMETSSRLRVVRPGYKLKSGTGEDIGKQFGSLTYGECQTFCLDFQPCETVSYCLSSGECILSMTHGDNIGNASFVEDGFCSVLTRKYADSFIRSPGIVLSQNAIKIIDASSDEDCAKACVKESSFNCLSFDSCRTENDKNACRLHSVHTLDVINDESPVKKENVCGHYSKKYTYDFKRESKKKTVGDGVVLSKGSTTEQCAKGCIEYNQGQCRGFDLCQGRDRETSCVVLTQKPSDMKTAYSDQCTHFTRSLPSDSEPKRNVSNSVAGGVGFLLFLIGCVLGGAIVFGVAYCRVNRSR